MGGTRGARTGGEVGRIIGEAIGLDLDKVRGFTLRCYPGEFATVEVESHVLLDEPFGLAPLTTYYDLVKREDAP